MKNFLQGRSQLSVDPLRTPALKNAALHLKPHDASAMAAPQVEVVKQGDKVMRLVVTCTCGEKIEIECIYPPGS